MITLPNLELLRLDFGELISLMLETLFSKAIGVLIVKFNLELDEISLCYIVFLV